MVQPWAGLSDRYYTTNFRIQPMQGLHYTVRKKGADGVGSKMRRRLQQKGRASGSTVFAHRKYLGSGKKIVVKTAGLQLDRGSSAHADVNQDNQDGTI